MGGERDRHGQHIHILAPHDLTVTCIFVEELVARSRSVEQGQLTGEQPSMEPTFLGRLTPVHVILVWLKKMQVTVT
jgi:hypothetical protein